MAETQVLERTPDNTVVKVGGNGQQVSIPTTLPILPIRNVVVFPGTVMPLNVGRQKSKNLLDEVMPGEKMIGVVTQKNGDAEEPEYSDLNTVGVAATTLKLFKPPDGNQSIIVHGIPRFRLMELTKTAPFLVGRIEVLEDPGDPAPAEIEALVSSV